MTHENFINFLMVEDDEDHAVLVKRTLEEHRISNRVYHVSDGIEALNFLRKKGEYHSYPTPDVVILDLKLPRKSGHEVLAEIKNDKNLKKIPVVILTTSNLEIDKNKAYLKHANSYLIKPLDFEKFKRMIDELSLYWGVLNNKPDFK